MSVFVVADRSKGDWWSCGLIPEARDADDAVAQYLDHVPPVYQRDIEEIRVVRVDLMPIGRT